MCGAGSLGFPLLRADLSTRYLPSSWIISSLMFLTCVRGIRASLYLRNLCSAGRWWWCLGGWGRGISEFEASQVYREGKERKLQRDS